MTPSDSQTRTILAILGVLSVMSAFILMMFVQIPEANKDTINIIIGALLSQGFTLIYQFFFGSSAGGQRTTQALVESTVANASGSNPTSVQVTTPNANISGSPVTVTESNDGPPTDPNTPAAPATSTGSAWPFEPVNPSPEPEPEPTA